MFSIQKSFLKCEKVIMLRALTFRLEYLGSVSIATSASVRCYITAAVAAINHEIPQLFKSEIW